jgi:hypothetical protein
MLHYGSTLWPGEGVHAYTYEEHRPRVRGVPMIGNAPGSLARAKVQGAVLGPCLAIKRLFSLLRADAGSAFTLSTCMNYHENLT